MRKVVLLNDLDISDIISDSLYTEYVRLLKKDIAVSFSKREVLFNAPCPGCGGNGVSCDYAKMGMSFKICAVCGSHYVSPRPNAEALESFYKMSGACQYWRSQILNLSDSQLYYIYGPRVHWISGLVDEFIIDDPVLLDVETKYPHLLKNLITENVFKSISTFKPLLFERNNLLPSDIGIMDNIDENHFQVNVITAFETLERMVNPQLLFALAYKVCKPGGLLLLTTASCSGFEYQILGKNAPNINPINRMNLLSIETLRKSIENAGFELIELSTPGRLDAEIVRQALEVSRDINIDPFWKYFFNTRDKHAWQNLQEFLQVNLLSSHVRIAARKKINKRKERT